MYIILRFKSRLYARQQEKLGHIANIRTLVRHWHGSNNKNESWIDKILGIQPWRTEHKLDLSALIRVAGNENFNYTAAPYSIIRSVTRWAQLSRKDVFYDLGAGYGRALIYGALITNASFRGIEVVPQRVAQINRLRLRLGLDNLDVRQGNACDEDISDGTVFFLFNPFFQDSLRKVGERLRCLAAHKSFAIATIAVLDSYFTKQKWLTEDRAPCPISDFFTRYAVRLFRTS